MTFFRFSIFYKNKNKLIIIPLPDDPTHEYLKNMRKTIKSFKHALDDDTKKNIINDNAYAPYIKGLPKIHKENAPLRPIINFRSAPSYLLASYLLQQFTKIIKIPNSTAVKNSFELIEKLKDFELQDDYKLISFDIVGMYSNISVDDCIDALSFYLHKVDGTTSYSHVNFKLDNDDIYEYLELTKLVLKQNYFQFDNVIYFQKLGLPMGSPLSGFLANLVLSRIECNIFNQFKSNIKFWSRYVDDTCTIFKPTRTTKFEKFFEFLNNMHPTLKFTFESEENNTLNFLDVSIMRNNNQLSFKVFRKETNNDRYIDGLSAHSINSKYAAIANLSYRAIFMPMSFEDRELELNYIKNVCFKNNLDPNFVDKFTKKYELKKRIMSITSLLPISDVKIWTKICYNPGLSIKLETLCKSYQLSPVIYNCNSLGRFLPKLYNSGSTRYAAGVYQLQCNDCNSYYVGQTKVGFYKRFEQHKSAIRNVKPERSNFADHIISDGHNCNVTYKDNLKIVQLEKDWVRRNYLEACHIRQVDSNANYNCVNAVKFPIKSNFVHFAVRMHKQLDSK